MIFLFKRRENKTAYENPKFCEQISEIFPIGYFTDWLLWSELSELNMKHLDIPPRLILWFCYKIGDLLQHLFFSKQYIYI